MQYKTRHLILMALLAIAVIIVSACDSGGGADSTQGALSQTLEGTSARANTSFAVHYPDNWFAQTVDAMGSAIILANRESLLEEFTEDASAATGTDVVLVILFNSIESTGIVTDDDLMTTVGTVVDLIMGDVDTEISIADEAQIIDIEGRSVAREHFTSSDNDWLTFAYVQDNIVVVSVAGMASGTTEQHETTIQAILTSVELGVDVPTPDAPVIPTSAPVEPGTMDLLTPPTSDEGN